jgi:hypothetical protein
MRHRTGRIGTPATVVALAFAIVVPASAAVPAAAAPKATGSLSDVVCPTPASCFAVGSYDDAKHANFQPLVGRLTGGTWTLKPAPAPNAPANKSRGVLNGVACATANRCFAVGGYDAGNGSGKRNLIEQWRDNKWAIASRLRRSGSHESALVDAACFSATRCFAVGTWSFEGVEHADIAQWNGSAWSFATVPHIHGVNEVRRSRLLGVSCVRAKSCFAVGSYLDNRTMKVLAMRFDGTRWSVVPTPPPAKPLTYVSLSSVSCASATVCNGVGRYGDAKVYGAEEGVSEVRAMRWNGIRWLDVDSPSNAGSPYDLAGIACPATDVCLAVGSARSSATGQYRALVERWDGSAWTVVSTGLTAVPALNAIVCRSRTACVAVGGRGKPIVARMQNGSWTAASVPITLGPA